jgi:hypothetical protein
MDKKSLAPEDKVCGNCFAPQISFVELLACTRCGLVPYFSKDYQRAHWKANQKEVLHRQSRPGVAATSFRTG